MKLKNLNLMNSLGRIAKTAAKIEANELRAVLLSFSFVFTILASYYILRSIRDGLASEYGLLLFS